MRSSLTFARAIAPYLEKLSAYAYIALFDSVPD